MPLSAWRQDCGGWLADLLLEREAALIRGGASPVPHDFAGLVIGDEEIDALLSVADRGGDADAPELLRSAPGAGGASGSGAEPSNGWDAAIEQARDHLDRTLAPTPLGAVARTARLGALASQVLAVLVSVELDLRRQRLAAFVQNDVTRPRLTLALVARLFGPAGLDIVAPDGPLRVAALIELTQDGPWSLSQVVPTPALCWAVAGVRGGEPDLGLDVVDVDLSPDPVPVTTADPPAEPQILLVSGADPARRRQLVAGEGLLRLAISGRPETSQGWEALVCHATVTGRSPMLETEALSASDRRWVERAAHLPWVISSPRELPLDCLPRRARRELYAGDRVIATDADWRALAGVTRPAGTRLDRTQLELVAPALGEGGEGLPSALRRLASGHLDLLTRRTRPWRSWKDLVVDDEQRDGLELLCARWRHRDRVYDDWGFPALPSAGVVALFSGPSGTGKTLAAEVVAGELRLDLYRLDLSSVVSKYIGETEKNLEQVFAAASAGEVVLFFDEADALFGKRSAVSDAHDRYANIEVAYLLQRLEEHDGLVVLATNLQQNIDPAFLRRIDVVVSFPEPDEAKRRALWPRSFGVHAPVDGIDFDWLAQRFDLTGGEIRNVALEAAFRAARSGEAISMAHLLAAMRREMRKAGRLFKKEDFADWLASPARPAEPVGKGAPDAAAAR